MSQRRQPRGIPSGGEFASSTHDDAALSLSSGLAPISYRRVTAIDEDTKKRLEFFEAIPAHIADADIRLDEATLAEAAEATMELVRFDAELGDRVQHFSPILLRTESGASSEIERLTANARNIYAAEIGAQTGENARLIHGNTMAMEEAIRLSDDTSPESIKAMHHALMGGQSHVTPGEFRSDHVRLGGTSLETATYVAPDADSVPEYMDDLCEFANRPVSNPVAHIAIAHAQFETIHPFGDGNGRTGRALVHSLLRKYGASRGVSVPISSGLLVDVDGYFDAIDQYQAGDPHPIVQKFSDASRRAVSNAREMVEDIDRVREGWDERVKARRDSGVHRLMDTFRSRPVLGTKDAAVVLGIEERNAHMLLSKLRDAGILTSSKDINVGTVWRAQEVLDAIDSFAQRSGRRRLKKLD